MADTACILNNSSLAFFGKRAAAFRTSQRRGSFFHRLLFHDWVALGSGKTRDDRSDVAQWDDIVDIHPFQRMARHAGIERGFGIFDDRDAAPPLYFSQASDSIIEHPGQDDTR